MKPVVGTRTRTLRLSKTSDAKASRSSAPLDTNDDHYAGTSRRELSPNPRTSTMPSSITRTRTHAPPSIEALLASIVKPRADLTVLELGPPRAASAFASVRGQVTAFVDDVNDAAALDALTTYHHVEPRDVEPLNALGVTEERFDVVVTRADDIESAAAAKTLVASLARGGTLVVHTNAKRLPPALVAAALDAGLALGDKSVRLDDGARAFVLRRAGARDPLAIDRTACVDRKRVATLIASALVDGPAHLDVVDDHDATLRTQLDALRASIDNGVVDVAKIPFPDRVARSATKGEANVDCLVVFAHPDDESGYAAGALAKLHAAGKKMHAAVATDGGGGLDATGDASSGALGDRRRHELESATKALGIEGVTVLGLEDAGMYRDDHRAVPITAADALALWGTDAALEKIVRAIREQRPRAILGFDPTRDPDYGLHGHHLAMGVVTAVAVHLAADPRAFPEQGLEPWSVGEHWTAIPPACVGGRQAEVVVDAAAKKRALESYRTQAVSLDGKLADVDAVEHWHFFQGRDGPTLFR